MRAHLDVGQAEDDEGAALEPALEEEEDGEEGEQAVARPGEEHQRGLLALALAASPASAAACATAGLLRRRAAGSLPQQCATLRGAFPWRITPWGQLGTQRGGRHV